MPTVAIASEFLDAFARIPRAQQKKVREFTEKFKINPTSSAINYEKIHAVKDAKVRTVRIDQKYRAVVLHPDQGEVYILAWVDNHDAAMAWAAKRTFEINSVTGALQIISVSEIESTVKPKEKRTPGLLDQFDDELLLSFGMPAVLLPAVRAIQNAQQLLALTKHLPAELAEAVLWLAEGIPPEEVREAVTVKTGKKVDISDLAAALQHPDSRRRFVTIQSEQDLSVILNAPLEKWRIFLHPNQERLVTKNFNGPARVLGGPGTGKTVCAMHRARYLAKTVCSSAGDKVLFTTYTANLAQNVAENLRNLCGEEMKHIEVSHLHSWAVRFMRDQGVEFDIASADEINESWQDALLAGEKFDFDIGFLRQEWDHVVQTNGIQSRADYLKVLRMGRGRALTRPQRGQVWRIFEKYVEALYSRGKHEWLSVIQATRRFLDENKPKLPYRAVIVDEAQDFHPEEWKLIRALIIPSSSNDLFLVGDPHQRIYGRKVVLRDCGINIQGRSSRLKINYRTTEQIRTWAMAMLQGIEVDDLDGERDQATGYMSLLSGPSPEVRHFDSQAEEQDFLRQQLEELLQQRSPEDICLVARTNKLVRDGYQVLLKNFGVKCTLLDKTGEGKGVRLATMHRVKGLEFPVMILASINAGVMPLYLKDVETDPTSRAEHEHRERSLLFVAATRARDKLIVTSWGKRSPFLPM